MGSDKFWKRQIRQEPNCHYCGTRLRPPLRGMPPHRDSATIDHKIPIAHKGTNDPSNLVAACYFCNNARATLEYETFLNLIKTHGRVRGCFMAVEMRRIRDRNKGLS